MTDATNHPLFPKLLHAFTSDAPTLRATADAMYAGGCEPMDLLWALAEHAPDSFTVCSGRGRAQANFCPDFGMSYARVAPEQHVEKSNFVPFDLFVRTDTQCWTAGVMFELGNVMFARNFDFSDRLFARLLNASIDDADTRASIWRLAPGGLVLMPVVANVTSVVGEPVALYAERFRPFIVQTVTVQKVNVLKAVLI